MAEENGNGKKKFHQTKAGNLTFVGLIALITSFGGAYGAVKVFVKDQITITYEEKLKDNIDKRIDEKINASPIMQKLNNIEYQLNSATGDFTKAKSDLEEIKKAVIILKYKAGVQ